MSSIFLIVDEERHEQDVVHGMFTSLAGAIAAGPKIVKRDEDSILTIVEHMVDVVYAGVKSDSTLAAYGILAEYAMDGTILVDNRADLNGSLGL